MSGERFSQEEWQMIGQAVARLRASVMAITFGIAGGTILFLATIWLIIQGPTAGATHVGPTLGLLSNYFPGYSVSWSGAVVGFFYGCLTGAIAGFVTALLYNRIAGSRENRD